MKRKILVLQCVDWRTPGRFLLDLASTLPVEFHVVESMREPLPQGSDFDALILLGESMVSEDKDGRLSYEREKKFLLEWLVLDKPCLGFCLGHQGILDAFQAKAVPNFVNSVGFIHGHLTHDGRLHPLFKGIGPTFSLFKWHDHAVQIPLPQNFILLATSSDCVVEAFTIKGRPHIIGLQCDNHAAHPDDVRSWLKSDKAWLDSLSLGKAYGNELLKDAESSLVRNQKVFTQLIRNFVSLV